MKNRLIYSGICVNYKPNYKIHRLFTK